MKHSATIFLLTFLLLFCFTSCQRQTPSSEQSTMPEPTDFASANSDPTDPTIDMNFEVRRETENIFVYPFRADELNDAQETVQDYLEDVSQESGVLTYTVERIAYDPIMTDVHVQQNIAGAPVDGWTEDDYYERQISFAVTYSATYDHTKSPVQDTEHHTISVRLRRENTQSPWEFQDSGAPVEEYSNQAMGAGDLKSITDADGRVRAGYHTMDDGCWLYLCDDNTGKIRLLQKDLPLQPEQPNISESTPVETISPTENPVITAVWDESDYQEGSPIRPQPGDTQSTWNPSLADEYPSDNNCSDMQLLEKWMSVEGLTMEDLDARGCRQLILVVARETDGVQTDTICYQKLADGSWTPVDGLTRMQGWTGRNGILHERKRNSDTSPAGLWSLGLAFGNSQKPSGLKMPWRDVTPNTDWVCDENSIYFNTWQERNDPTLTEAWSNDVEHLEDYTDAYAYACVIRYNTPPYTVPERGCAIFFHCSKGPTGGCIGLPRTDMINTLLWMDPSQNPYILITGHQNSSEE